MAIEVGSSLPEIDFFTLGENGPEVVASQGLFAGKKVALFAVPGAFTPTCHNTHVPGFIANHDQLKAKGVDAIYCVAVNDPFVTKAWAQSLGLDDKITVLSDGNGTFTKAIGMELDGSGAGLGLRSLRYAMLVEDGVVKVLNIDEVPSEATASAAEALLEKL